MLSYESNINRQHRYIFKQDWERLTLATISHVQVDSYAREKAAINTHTHTHTHIHIHAHSHTYTHTHTHTHTHMHAS